MNLRCPYDVGKFLSGWATGGFPKRAQLHGISYWFESWILYPIFEWRFRSLQVNVTTAPSNRPRPIPSKFSITFRWSLHISLDNTAYSGKPWGLHRWESRSFCLQEATRTHFRSLSGIGTNDPLLERLKGTASLGPRQHRIWHIQVTTYLQGIMICDGNWSFSLIWKQKRVKFPALYSRHYLFCGVLTSEIQLMGRNLQ
jgi:hypothetical protein